MSFGLHPCRTYLFCRCPSSFLDCLLSWSSATIIICYPNFYNPRPPWNWDNNKVPLEDIEQRHEQRPVLVQGLLPHRLVPRIFWMGLTTNDDDEIQFVRSYDWMVANLIQCLWSSVLSLPMMIAICMIMWINYSKLNEHSNQNKIYPSRPKEIFRQIHPEGEGRHEIISGHSINW